MKNETFSIQELQEGKSVISGKWVHVTKLDDDGNVKTQS